MKARRTRRAVTSVALFVFVLASLASASQDPATNQDPPQGVVPEDVVTDATTVEPAQEGDPAPPGEPKLGEPKLGETQPGAPAKAAPVEAAPPMTPYEVRYHDLAQVRDLLQQWVANAPCEVEPVTLVAEGRELDVPAIQWGAPGPTRLAERPTVFLIGGLDGVSVSGGEAVLSVTAAMLAEPPRADLAFVSIPWASIDALGGVASGAVLDGRSREPADDDGDGAFDEDGPDDADNDGKILEMLIEDPDGPWTFSSDPRFLASARPGDSPRFWRVPEGKDDDADGRYNEDASGGTCLDRNFPVGWPGPGSDPACGPYPLSEPVARALADLVLARRTVSVLLFQGNHGALAIPGGLEHGDPGGHGDLGVVPWPAGADALDFETITAGFARATRRVQETTLVLARARGRASPGAALDWLYTVPGALSLEVGVWGPDVEEPPEPGDVALSDALYGGSERPTPLGAGTPPSLADLAWARWLDNTRGGIGFENWHPVTLDDGTQVRIGGWTSFTRLNPPEDSLPRALEGLDTFVGELANALPRLELELGDVVRDGEICRIHARVTNHGTLSTGLWTTSRRPGREPDLIGGGCVVELDLPPGAQLLAGEARSALGRLPGSSSSRELSWVVLAAQGSVVSITVRSAWSLPSVREVQP